MPNALAANLVRLRKKHKLSQREAAAGLGISAPLLSHYERGIRDGSIDFLLRAAQYYTVSCDVLLGRDTQEEQALALLRTDHALESDGTFSPLTVARAASALSGGEEAPSALMKAMAVLLLRASGRNELHAHWIDAALVEILSGVHAKKSAAPCVQTVRKYAKEIVKETIGAIDFPAGI